MFFPDMSFRSKLTFLLLQSIIFALVMTCIGLAMYERSSFRSARINELTILANTLGENAAASLAFKDPKTAGEILGALHAEPHIVVARLNDADDYIFAEYRRPAGQYFAVPAHTKDGAQFTSNYLSWSQGVFLDGDRTGTIIIVSDLTAFGLKIREYAKIASLVFIFAILFTYPPPVFCALPSIPSFTSQPLREEFPLKRTILCEHPKPTPMKLELSSPLSTTCSARFKRVTPPYNTPETGLSSASGSAPRNCLLKLACASRPSGKCALPRKPPRSPTTPRANSLPI
jgi:hypothetical protein